MLTSDMIRQLCRYEGVSQTELCRRIGQSAQNFGKKLKRETVSLDELGAIAKALGAKYEQRFVLPDGESISITMEESGSVFSMSDDILCQNAGTSLLEALFESVYYIDLDADTYLVRFRKEWLDRAYSRDSSYTEDVREWINRDVFMDDREEMLREIEPARIKERLSERDMYSVTYRSMHTGVPRYQEMRIINASGTEDAGNAGNTEKNGARYITACFIDRDELVRETRQRELERQRLIYENARIAQQKAELSRDSALMADALSRVYSMSILCNLAENRYRVVDYRNHMNRKAPDEGDYDELTRHVLTTLPYEDDRKKFSALFSREALLNAYHDGTPSVFGRYRQTGDDGLTRWIEVTHLFEENEENDPCTIILLRDVTLDEAQKQQEQRYREIIENAAQSCVSMYRINLDTDEFEILHLNPRSEERFKEYRELISKNPKYSYAAEMWVRCEIHPDDAVRMRSELRADTIRRNLEHDSYYSRLFREARFGCAYFEMRVQALSDRGEGTWIVVSFFNVDEETRIRLENEKKLERALEESRLAIDAKRQFLFNMSHDIRTPMNAVLGYTDMLERHRDDPGRFTEYLQKLQLSEKQMMELLNDVLLMSHIEAGTMKLEEQETTLAVSSELLLPIIEGDARKKGVTFLCDGENSVPDTIYADIPRLNELLLCVLGNAVKFTPAGGTVRYRIERLPDTESEKLHVRFTVSDTGIGIRREFLPSIFDAFRQDAPQELESGVGLGLTIARNLAEMMGGTITADSIPGKGSTFQIELPFRRAAAAETPVREDADARALAVLRGKRVLLVEDNEMNREIARDILEDFALTVEEAADGQQSVDAYLSHPVGYYDAVLMDIRMPVMDGFTAAKEIRRSELTRGGRLPILAVTANAYEEDRKASADAGMDFHLEKPIDRELLLRRLAESVEASAAGADSVRKE